jgi:hypothetical protein
MNNHSEFRFSHVPIAPVGTCDPARMTASAPGAASLSIGSLHGGKRPIRRKSARSGTAGCPLARYERRDSQLPSSVRFDISFAALFDLLLRSVI